MTTGTIHRERVPLETADVGAELLDILSRGLYTDPFDAVREYVQNAVDAGAKEIIITHTGTALLIRDDGSGMGWEELKNARRFGVSIKDTSEAIGFRGIGIYASYGIAGNLRFVSRRPPSNEQLGMEIDFASIKQRLDRNRHVRGRRVAIPLADVLYEHSFFTRQPYSGPVSDASFTLVALEDIDIAFREKLADRDRLRDYLLRTVRVRFSPDDYGAEVNRLIERELRIAGVVIKLRYHGHDELILQRKMPHDIASPQYRWLTNADREHIAFVWYSLTEGRRAIQGESGFILKLKSFTLGEHDSLKSLWPSQGGGTLHNWYFGEVHVLDSAGVVPNAARNGLEPGINTEILYAEIRTIFTELNRIADETRGYRMARDRQIGLQERTEDILLRATESNVNPAELFSDAVKLREEIDDASKTLTRTTRGRYARKLSASEDEVLLQLRILEKQVHDIENKARRAAQAAITGQSGTRVTSRSTRPEPETASRETTPPLGRYLREAVSQLRIGMGSMVTADVQASLLQLEDAADAELAQRFFLILDGLVAQSISLPEPVEEARRRLRGRANLEPDGPITLLRALAIAGFEPTNSRETIIIDRLDAALLEASGGRELPYYRLLQSVANHDFVNGIPLG